MTISIKQIPNGKWKENCYVVSNLNSDALIIDPGGAEKRIVNFIKDKSLNVCAILNTHAHYDHIGAISKLKEKYLIPLFLHSKDKKLLNTANLYANLFDGIGPIKIPSVDYYFDQIDIQDYLTSFSINVLSTPGHTWGSVCILIEDCLFTGDTLLNGKIGRVDLPGGDAPTLKKSLTIISKLPHQTNIYPGHDASSTIGHELKYNNNFIQALQ
jgi:hydroxyacylglutathione hydrolase